LVVCVVFDEVLSRKAKNVNFYFAIFWSIYNAVFFGKKNPEWKNKINKWILVDFFFEMWIIIKDGGFLLNKYFENEKEFTIRN
jgi:hypothetical protein